MADKKTTKIEVEKLEEVEALAEEVAEIEQPVKVLPKKNTYVVQDGDSYAILGQRYAPLGTRGFLHAQYLEKLNGGKALVTGSEIKLNG
jgi:hypothetical protein